MIYIDPPYNTGKDFVYKDNFTDNIENYKEITGQINKEGIKLTTNTDSDGRYHSNWLNMIYPRLKLARNLLTDDGVIFISIDDNEQANLKKLCDEIFGEENFRNVIQTRRRVKSLNSQFSETGLYSLNVGLEYILVYSKSKSFLMNAIREEKENFSETGRWDVFWSNADRPTMRYEILGFTPNEGQWRTSKEKAEIAIENYKIYQQNFSKEMSIEEYYKKTGTKNFIRRIENGVGKNGGVQHWIAPSESKLRTTNWSNLEVSQISKEIDLPFENPKNKMLIIELLKLVKYKKYDIILDFFSGSATTAHSVMQLNAEDGGNRKYIMVQLPELCDEGSEAYKAGYKNICEIGKERIRRAGEKIKSDESLPIENREKLDVGFKVFKLDSSNIKEWDTNTEDLKQSLLDSMENVKIDRSSLDILYEILLKYGLDLNIPIEENKNFYSIGGGSLLVSLDKEINDEVINSICEEYKKLLELDKDFKTTVILRDNSFKNDVDKTNAIKKLEQVGINEIRSI
ncbi:site-specific DNA-methyltransferase [Fusobacterium polymorphum]